MQNTTPVCHVSISMPLQGRIVVNTRPSDIFAVQVILSSEDTWLDLCISLTLKRFISK